ncbi:hypothetical protein MMC22_007694 [Lobaria immixta]|nr:hypothetical protein [Lobaria immixta]
MEAIADPTTPFSFLRLPMELQIQILGYLLPNENAIGVLYGEQVVLATEDPYYYDEAVQYRSGNEACYPAILGVNRQIYEQGHHITYNRVFKIKVTESGYSFLKYHRESVAEDLIFPFNNAKEIQIDIHFKRTTVRLFRLLTFIRKIQATLAGYSLKSLKINLFDEDKQIRRIMTGGLSRAAKLVESDMELMLQPFKLLQNVGMCKISLLLLPPPTKAATSSEQDNQRETTGTSDQFATKEARSLAVERLVPYLNLLRECKEEIINPDIYGYGDAESLAQGLADYKEPFPGVISPWDWND